MTTSSYQSGILFTQAHRLVRQRIVDTLATHNITFTGWSLLSVVLQAKDGIRLSSVAASLHVKAPLITMESATLIDEGLLVRMPHQTDSRAKLLLITPKGKKLLEVIETETTKQIEQLLTGLTANEIKVFQKTLTVIIQNS